MAKIDFKKVFDSKKINFTKNKNRKIKTSKVSFNDSFTLMVVPNSQKKILNFKFNWFSVFFILVVLVFLVFSFFYLNTSLSVSNQKLKSVDANLTETQANLNLVLDSVSKLGKAYEDYKQNISEISDNLNLNKSENEVQDVYNDSDLASLSYLEENSNSQYLPQIQEINSFMKSLSNTIEPIKEASHVIHNQKQILADIPNYWPVIGSNRTSMEFGPNMHPITHKQYIHKGFDIPGVTGLPIVASANGKVIKVAFDTTNYGIHIILEHKYGFKTRYAHLSGVNVQVGDVVRQGQIIGRMGATGLATGPHLHFEIIIGNQIVDPSSYLRMLNNFQRSNY